MHRVATGRERRRKIQAFFLAPSRSILTTHVSPVSASESGSRRYLRSLFYRSLSNAGIKFDYVVANKNRSNRVIRGSAKASMEKELRAQLSVVRERRAINVGLPENNDQLIGITVRTSRARKSAKCQREGESFIRGRFIYGRTYAIIHPAGHFFPAPSSLLLIKYRGALINAIATDRKRLILELFAKLVAKKVSFTLATREESARGREY